MVESAILHDFRLPKDFFAPAQLVGVGVGRASDGSDAIGVRLLVPVELSIGLPKTVSIKTPFGQTMAVERLAESRERLRAAIEKGIASPMKNGQDNGQLKTDGAGD